MSNRKLNSIFVLSFLILSILLIFCLLMTASGSTKEIIGISKGQTLYTQFSLYYEKGHYLTTNYHRGILLPVNSEVKFIKASNDSIEVTLPDGEELNIVNVKGFSGEEIGGIFTRTLSTTPVDLSQFSDDEKKAILLGKAEKGMKKAAVIAALGYPPKHKTPNLEMNQWQYWQNRFNTFIVVFENDKVIRIVN